MQCYHAILWDWNGTLLDDTATCVDVVNEILVQYGTPPITRTYYLEHFDFPVARFYEGLGFDFNHTDYAHLARDYIARYRQRQMACSLRPHVSEVLTHIQAQGLEQSILSAYQTDLLREVVSHFDLGHHFTYVQGLDNFHAASKVEAGATLLRQLDWPRHQVLLVGDTTHDSHVAESLDIDCILLSGGHQHIDRIQTCGVPVLNSLQALPDYLGL